MHENLPVIISIITVLLVIISSGISIKTFAFLKKSRANDKRPVFECSESFGAYANIEKRIPNIHLSLKNTGEKVILFKIEEKTGKEILCSQLNKTINNNELLELQINSNEMIKHEKLNYEIILYLKDIDNKTYTQTIEGPGIYPKISPSKVIK